MKGRCFAPNGQMPSNCEHLNQLKYSAKLKIALDEYRIPQEADDMEPNSAWIFLAVIAVGALGASLAHTNFDRYGHLLARAEYLEETTEATGLVHRFVRMKGDAYVAFYALATSGLLGMSLLFAFPDSAHHPSQLAWQVVIVTSCLLVFVFFFARGNIRFLRLQNTVDELIAYSDQG